MRCTWLPLFKAPWTRGWHPTPSSRWRLARSKPPARARAGSSHRRGIWSASAVGLRTTLRQWLGPLTLPGAARRLRTLIDHLQPDLIHAMRIPYEGMLAALAGAQRTAGGLCVGQRFHPARPLHTADEALYPHWHCNGLPRCTPIAGGMCAWRTPGVSRRQGGRWCCPAQAACSRRFSTHPRPLSPSPSSSSRAACAPMWTIRSFSRPSRWC